MTREQDPFVEIFRASAPYINAHSGRTFVIVFGGEVLESAELAALLFDLALLHSLVCAPCIGCRCPSPNRRSTEASWRRADVQERLAHYRRRGS